MSGRVLRWEGPGPLPPIPDINYAVFILQQMATHGNAIAMVDAENEKQWTFSQLCTLVPRVSGGLAVSGVGLGDIVLFLVPTHIDYPLVLLSILHRGATCVPINPTLNADELVHVLRTSRARWAVVHEASLAMAEAAFSRLPPATLRKMWVLGSAPGRATLDDLLIHNPVPPVTRAEGLDSTKMAAVMPFSSGTTGPAKGVLLSHCNILASHIRSQYDKKRAPEKGKIARQVFSSMLLMLPLAHMYGQVILCTNLLYGGTTVILPKFTARKFFEAIQKYKITVAPLVPHLIQFLKDSSLLNKYDASSLMAVFSAAAPIDSDTINAFVKMTGVPVARGYGMTETSGAMTATRPPPDDNPASVGKIIPYAEIKVVGKNGELLDEGEEGEVCAHGAGIMLGYANNPAATAATIDADGWLHTGDLGYYDRDGFLYITDRKKDLIKVKAYQVSPYELEELLRQHLGVADVAVVGVPHNTTGEAPRAYIVLKPSANFNASHILQFVADRVASYKQLKGGIKFVNSIPRNSTGKIIKRQLKADVMTPASRL